MTALQKLGSGAVIGADIETVPEGKFRRICIVSKSPQLRNSL